MKNKDEIMCRLNAILRELTCMNQGDFENHIKEGKFEIEFCRYCSGESKKVKTKIIIEKVDIE